MEPHDSMIKHQAEELQTLFLVIVHGGLKIAAHLAAILFVNNSLFQGMQKRVTHQD